jgi:Ferritin-like domain
MAKASISAKVMSASYAYALKQLEAAFYRQVTKTPYADMASADTDILSGIRDHEIAHRDKAALKKNAIPALEVDFTKIDFNSRDSVLKTAMTFEDLGVAAYNGPE